MRSPSASGRSRSPAGGRPPVTSSLADHATTVARSIFTATKFLSPILGTKFLLDIVGGDVLRRGQFLLIMPAEISSYPYGAARDKILEFSKICEGFLPVLI